MLGAQADSAQRLDHGRFTFIAFPADLPLARSLLAAAARNDSFPGLPRPREHVLVAIAPDMARFRAWSGAEAPDWGAAVAIPDEQRIVMQGSASGSDAGDPRAVLRHELAHLALHENLGELPPRWFDEGYASVAAREWRRDDVLATNVALALRGVPTLDQLEASFGGGATAAQSAYALSYRAVVELASLDPDRGLTLFFRYWENGKNLDAAVRQAFGITLSGFEREFQLRVRRRYGALALFADLTLVFLVTGLALLPFFVARRARDRRRLRELLVADAAAERAERESILAELLGPEPAPAEPSTDDENGAREPSAERSTRRDDEP
jgi:hypothetical protein